MTCSICQHPRSAEITEDYCYTLSIRKTAERYGVSKSALHRHTKVCLLSIWSEHEEIEYKQALEQVYSILLRHYSQPVKKPRPKSLITKKFVCNWGRKAKNRRKQAERGTLSGTESFSQKKTRVVNKVK